MKTTLLLISIFSLFKLTTNSNTGATKTMSKQNFLNDNSKPRGIRNNNPLNIEKGDNWQGSIKGKDERFLTFSDPKYGFRAGAKLLKNYQRLYNLDTMHKIINRYAPEFENDTNSYASHIAHSIGIGVHDKITLNDDILLPMLRAMTLHENGQNPYSDSVIKSGISLA